MSALCLGESTAALTPPRSSRCGSCANESAFKAAFMVYRHRQRQRAGLASSSGPEFSPEEMASCMKNQAPGSPALSVLSFTSAFHGRLFGSLSATRSKAIHKVRPQRGVDSGRG